MKTEASRPPLNPGESRVLGFEGWEIHPDERVLRVDGEVAKIGSRAFDVLLVLAQRAGRVVSKRELFELAWPGRVVEENNLTVQITALRKLLGSEAIVNASGIGYRLAARPAAAAPLSMNGAAAVTLYGRDADLEALAALVDVAPLVTLVGAGGVGKTTLARALIARRPGLPSGGVHWIDLSPIRPDTPLLPLVARSLGLQADPLAGSGDDLLRALGLHQALFVLDNCEHLLDEVSALLSTLLPCAGGLKWLATSQEPLRLAAESVYRLAPLAVPAADAPAEDLAASGALALFCARARAAGRQGPWTPEQLGTVAELCRQLDGLPLALEIAAARAATLGLAGLSDQIGQRLRLRAGTRDAPSRHHSLLQTYEWSYGLLAPVEQAVFRSLEPFVGGFDIGMVPMLHTVLGAGGWTLTEWEVLDALDALLAKSLLQGPAPDASGPTVRLRLLESARDFARLQLEMGGETEAVRAAHAEVLARQFASAFEQLEQSRDAEWGARYLPEHRNVSAALAWACGRERPELLARLVAALGQLESFAQVPSDLVHLPVPLAQLQAAPPPLRAAARCELGWAHYQDGQRDLGTQLTEQALADYEVAGDAAGAYRALTWLIRMYHGRPGLQDRALEMRRRIQAIDDSLVPLRSRLRFESSSAHLVGERRTLEQLRQLERLATGAGFEGLAADCRVNITDELMVQGRHAEVVRVSRELLASASLPPRHRELICHNLALSLVRLGRVDEARAPAREVLRTVPADAHLVVDIFAFAAAQGGRPEEAALMAGCSHAIKQRRDLRSEVAEAALIDATLAALTAALGDRRMSELMRAGADISTDGALALMNL